MDREYLKDHWGELKELAGRYVWYMSPDQALEDMDFFLVHIMGRTPEKVTDHLKEKFKITNDDLIKALHNARPGIFMYEDYWNKWNDKLGLDPPLPFPRKYPLSTPS